MNISRRDFGRLCVSGAASAGAGCSRAERPNAVIFYADDLRATALRLYNPLGVPTPNVERLARRGILYEQSYTPHPLCLPARVSLLTGQYSSTHGCRHNHKPLDRPEATWATAFRDEGYEVGIFGKNHCFEQGVLDQAFSVDYSVGSPAWNEALSSETINQIREHAAWLKEQGGALLPPTTSPFSYEIYPTHLASQRAVEFLDRHGGKPFVLLVSLTEPHTPNEAPKEFGDTMPPDRVTLPPFRMDEIRRKSTRLQIYNYLIRGSEIPEEYLSRCLSTYYAKAAFLDYELGRVMDALERNGFAENTILLFASDNGDFAAEHHLIVKTGSLLDSMVRMPMVLCWPARLAGGGREKALVSHIDIMPTLLELCGIPIPESVEGRRFPLKNGDPARAFVYAEYGAGGPEYTWEQARTVGPAKRLGDYPLQTEFELGELDKRERAGHLRMIRTRERKLIVDSNGDVELYDLTNDSDEFNNVHGSAAYRRDEEDMLKLLDAGQY